MKIGTVVKMIVDSKRGFYVVEPGQEMGERVLTPIRVDESRKQVKLTSEIEAHLEMYPK